MVIKNKNQKEVLSLYGDGNSIPEIAKILGKSQWSIYKWMARHSIPRRTSVESNRLRFKKKAPSFLPKTDLISSELALKTAALMLYWAEGSKRSVRSIDFANSDPSMGRIFITCLRKIYGVSESRIRIYLYCYSNQSVSGLIGFWAKTLNIKKNQFTKPYVRKDYLPEKYDRMPYGLVHVRYSDKKLVEQVWEDIELLKRNILI